LYLGIGGLGGCGGLSNGAVEALPLLLFSRHGATSACAVRSVMPAFAAMMSLMALGERLLGPVEWD
jgi:hypothetical protein